MEFEVYKDKADEYRWRLKSSNGKIIADSGEGYKKEQDCVTMISTIISNIRDIDTNSDILKFV